MCLETLAVRSIRLRYLLGLVPFWPFAVSLFATWLAGVALSAGTAVADDIPLPRTRPTVLMHTDVVHTDVVHTDVRTGVVHTGVVHTDVVRAGPSVQVNTSKTPTKLVVTTVAPSLAPPQEAYASVPDSGSVTVEAPIEPSACQLRLQEVAVMHPLPPIVGPGDCGAVDVVRLESIVLSDRTKVAVSPPATLRCTMAEAVAHWVREDVVPAVREFASPLREVDNYDSFECRGRNRVAGAKISEHGLANAIDVKAFKLADGTVLGPTDVSVPKDLREGLRQNACARFTTVLGPGSDSYHESHIHVDLAERKNGYRICQWDVREPAEDVAETADVPLPRPRPNLESSIPTTSGGKL